MNHTTGRQTERNGFRVQPLYLLVFLGFFQCVLSVVASYWVEQADAYPLYLAAYFAMGTLYLTSCHVLLQNEDTLSERRSVWVVLALALVMRAIFVPGVPTLSDDFYRYRWDGRVQLNGINPYGLPPESPELEHLRDEYYDGINNKDLPTIYPPLMQIAFLIGAATTDALQGMKGIFVLSDALLLFVLIGLLRAVDQNPHRVLIYAWCPLVITEVFASGHNDVLALTLLVAGLWALIRNNPSAAMILMGLSGASKFIAYLLAPLFVRTVRFRHLLWIAAASLVVALPYAVSVENVPRVFEGLFNYATRWRSNDSVFHVLFWLTGSLTVSKVIVGCSLVALTLTLVVKNTPPLRAMYLVIGGILLLTATIHPWYIVWIVPFLCVYPSAAWMTFTVTVALSYHAGYLSTPGIPWEDTIWIKWLEYTPLYGLGAWAWLRKAVTSEQKRKKGRS